MSLPFFASKFTTHIGAPVRLESGQFTVEIRVEYHRLDNTRAERVFRGFGLTDYGARGIALDSATAWMKELA